MKDGSHFRSGLTRSCRPLGDGQLGCAHGKGSGRPARRPALSTMVVVGAVFVSVAQPMTVSGLGPTAGRPYGRAGEFPQHAHQITVSVSTDTKAAISGAISSSAGGTLKATGANGVQCAPFPAGCLRRQRDGVPDARVGRPRFAAWQLGGGSRHNTGRYGAGEAGHADDIDARARFAHEGRRLLPPAPAVRTSACTRRPGRPRRPGKGRRWPAPTLAGLP